MVDLERIPTEPWTKRVRVEFIRRLPVTFVELFGEEPRDADEVGGVVRFVLRNFLPLYDKGPIHITTARLAELLFKLLNRFERLGLLAHQNLIERALPPVNEFLDGIGVDFELSKQSLFALKFLLMRLQHAKDF